MEHHFNTDYAVKYGIDESILINNLQFWIIKNKANKKHSFNERTWTYNTYKAFSEIFPYWNEHKIKRILDSLVNQKVILRENYNKSGYDRTCWYAFVDENSFLNSCNKQVADLQNGSNEIAAPIPYTNTVNNTSNTYTNKIYKDKKFLKPTASEINDYAKEIGFTSLDESYFLDHYESNGWLVGKNPMKDWKAAVRTWKRNSSKFTTNQDTNNTKIKLK